MVAAETTIILVITSAAGMYRNSCSSVPKAQVEIKVLPSFSIKKISHFSYSQKSCLKLSSLQIYAFYVSFKLRKKNRKGEIKI